MKLDQYKGFELTLSRSYAKGTAKSAAVQICRGNAILKQIRFDKASPNHVTSFNPMLDATSKARVFIDQHPNLK